MTLANFKFEVKGLDKLLFTIEEKNQLLRSGAMEMVTGMVRDGLNDVMIGQSTLHSVDNDPLSPQKAEMLRSNVTEVHSKSLNKFVGSISNTSEEATYAEFGYGLTGYQSPYEHGDVFNMEQAGWINYDLDSPSKLNDRSWWYTNADGLKVRTKGQPSASIFYKAYNNMVGSLGRYADKYIGGAFRK
jgi:hypothetical protein